jgi:hypothetical protein
VAAGALGAIFLGLFGRRTKRVDLHVQ